MAKKQKDLYPSNAWEYADWLYTTGRLTALEHITLKGFLLQLEEASSFNTANEGC
jgi:hypothetical protein